MDATAILTLPIKKRLRTYIQFLSRAFFVGYYTRCRESFILE